MASTAEAARRESSNQSWLDLLPVSPVRSQKSLSRAAVGQESFINSDTNLDSWEVLEELRALVEAEQLRMAAIPKVFELHEIDDALAVRPVA